MDNNWSQINAEVYERCSLKILNLEYEEESKEYDACRFELSGRSVICRNAKTTPKKNGQFVTFWKRNENGQIEPFEENDEFDFFLVNVRTENQFGQFVFPTSVLINKGIISTSKREGKRAFRVYPIWDIAKSKQAERTQKWQLKYFYEINTLTDFDKVVDLYGME